MRHEINEIDFTMRNEINEVSVALKPELEHDWRFESRRDDILDRNDDDLSEMPSLAGLAGFLVPGVLSEIPSLVGLAMPVRQTFQPTQSSTNHIKYIHQGVPTS
jgi:hypothetical protein